MMKTIENLVKADSTTKLGNHKVEVRNVMRNFIYYSTAICTVNDAARTYTVDNGGYATQSTTRAINDYRRYFESVGYTYGN